MKKFDRYIKQQLSEEDGELPVSVRSKIDQALSNLPEGQGAKEKEKPLYRYSGIAAVCCCAFVFLFLLPNVSRTYAQALEQIPVIGKIVKVITIRNYFYEDDTHELEVKVPQIEYRENEGVDYINADAEELTEVLVKRFYSDMERLGEGAHGSMHVDYEVITNTEEWFTLKLCINESAGSSDMYYKYYNLNKLTGKTAALSDLAAKEEFYERVEQEIREQMVQRMEEDKEAVYWVEKDSFGGEFVEITPEHNYFWNEEGNLGIPFDKYEVAPGYMGTPEFEIDFALIKDLMKAEIQEMKR